MSVHASPDSVLTREAWRQIGKDSEDATSQQLPVLLARTAALEHVFAKIDRLEMVMHAVRRDIEVCEQEVDEAERSRGAKPLQRMVAALPKLSFFQVHGAGTGRLGAWLTCMRRKNQPQSSSSSSGCSRPKIGGVCDGVCDGV
jgi:hypothetical protein